MKSSLILQKLRRLCKRGSSFLLLFQRSPAAQVLMPAEFNLASSVALMDSAKFAIATVVGLGAYDSVAGATTLTQISGSLTAVSGQPLSATFQVTNSPSTPQSWRIVGTPPAGISLPNQSGSINTLTGTSTDIGSKTVTIQAWQDPGFGGGVVQKSITLNITAPLGLAIATQPASVTINSGQTTTLNVSATGDGPLTYEWFEGASGTTTTPVGTNAASYTTPNLTTTTSYWVRVTNAGNTTGTNSNTATVTVRQPAAITTAPASTTINSGQTATLSVLASGDLPITYEWYRGPSGNTTNPVGTNSASFTTPALSSTTDFWVKVKNLANVTGVNSAAATVTVRQPPAITTAPAATSVNYGDSTTLSVVASGDGPFTYQWYQGASGVTTTPVGANSASFTTPALSSTTSYWVKVSNAANPAGVNSPAALVTVLLVTPAYVNAMSQSEGLFAITERGSATSTYFGWETWNDALDRASPINDSTPDIGTPTVGANFQTTNAEDHVIDNGDLSFASGTLAEQITVPTSGVVGAEGFTTIVMQIAAIPGTGPFPAAITLNSLYGVAPTVVQAVNSAGDGQLWAKWNLPGNEANYVITLTGAANQGNFALDKVVVDTHFSTAAYLSDAVASTPPSISTDASLATAVRNVAFNQTLVGQGGTAPYTWALISGVLPSGLSLSSSGVISGKPSPTATNSSFTVRLIDNTGFVVTKQFTLPVSPVFLTPVLQPIVFPTLTIGANFSYTVTALNYPKTFVITGLPLGLKFAPATGVISGRPLVSGLYNVHVRAVNLGGASAAMTARLIVRALDKNLVGTFGGTVTRDVALNRGLGGTVVVTTTSLGSYTVKLVGAFVKSTVTGASTAYTLTGNLAAGAPQISGTIGGQPLSLTLNPATGEMTGAIGPVLDNVKGWRLAWHALSNPADSLVGYYSMALDLMDVTDQGVATIPQGSGFATLSVSPAGLLTTVGKTADGETITSASFLSRDGEFWAYSALYKNGGSLQSVQNGLKLAEDTGGLFANNFVNGELTWYKPTLAGRAYPTTFGPIKLKAEGGYLAPASKGSIVLGLPDPGSVNLSFTDGGLASSATDPDMSFLFTDSNTIDLKNAVNPGKVAITLNVATGAVAGSFTLTELSVPPLVRSKIAFQGQVVRLSNGSHQAVGYFMLPQIPARGQAATATAILSGGFNLQ